MFTFDLFFDNLGMHKFTQKTLSTMFPCTSLTVTRRTHSSPYTTMLGANTIKYLLEMFDPLCAGMYHCVKSVRISRFSGPYFSAFGLDIQCKCGKIRIRKLRVRKLFTQCIFVSVFVCRCLWTHCIKRIFYNSAVKIFHASVNCLCVLLLRSLGISKTLVKFCKRLWRIWICRVSNLWPRN